MKYIVLCLSILSCDAGNIISEIGSAFSDIRGFYATEQLSDAADRGDLAGVKKAIASGADVHFCNDYALGKAAACGYLDIVQFLLTGLPENQRANIHAGNDYALRMAAVHGHLPVVRFLLELPEEQRANVHADDNNALRTAAALGHLPVVKFLLKHGADIHALGADIHALDDRALWVAAYHGHWDMVACLMHHGANQTRLESWKLDQLYNSTQAQEYVALEIHNALANNNWPELTKLLDIIPLNYFSGNIRKQIQQYFASEISTMLQKRNLSGLQALLNLVPFDYLPNRTQVQIREFIQQRALHGSTRIRKTKYS